MKPFKLTLALLISISTLALAQPSLQADTHTDAYLKQFRLDYSKAMRNKTPDLLGSYYAGDIRLMTEFQKTVTTKTAALHYFTSFFSRFDVLEYSRTELEVLDFGSQVEEAGNFSIRLKLKGSNTSYDLQGKYLDLWKKTGNNKLELITEAWHYNSSQIPVSQQLHFEDVPKTDVAMTPHVQINNAISFELAALNRLLETTVAGHDADVWVQFYTDDAKLFSTGHPIFNGRKEIDDYIKFHVTELPVFEKLDTRNDRIDDLGTFVIEYASHIATWRNGSSSGVGVGKDLRIWQRQSNGSLKMFRQIGMYD